MMPSIAIETGIGSEDVFCFLQFLRSAPTTFVICDTVTGVVDGVTSVLNGLQPWTIRFTAMQTDSVSLTAQQRVLLFDQIKSWTLALNKSADKLTNCPQSQLDTANGSDRFVLPMDSVCNCYCVCKII